MAITKFCKLDLVVHESVREEVMSELQRLGCCEVITTERAEEDQWRPESIKSLDEKLSDARFAIRFLEPYYRGEGSKIARMLGNKPKVSLDEISRLEESFDIVQYSAKLREVEKKLSEIRAELSRLRNIEGIVAKIVDFQLSLSLITKGTDYVTGIMAAIPVEQTMVFKSLLEGSINSDEGDFFISTPKEKDKEVYLIALFVREKKEEIRNLLTSNGASIIELDPRLLGTPVEELENMAETKKELIAEEEKLFASISDEAKKNFMYLQQLHDYYDLIKRRIEAIGSGLSTEHATWSKMWVPRIAIDRIQSVLSSYDSLVHMEISEPEEEDEPPVYLVSRKWASPFEPLTKLYGLPEYNGIDPTPFFAPFYFLFFGMCLGDAGYGAVLALIFLYAIKKYCPRKDAFKFFALFVLAGISSVLVGVLTGSLFGDMIDAFPILASLRDIKNSLKITDVMYNPMPFLGFSLFIGFVQIIFGLFIAFFDNLRKKDYIGAIGDQGGWITFLLGLALYILVRAGMLPPSLSSPSAIATIAGVCILVATQGREKKNIFSKLFSGIMSLYSVTSYLGDVLSYSRLLALGLATSAIAMIINTLTLQLFHIPYIGWLLGIILFAGGHIFSIAVNVLGAFVHSLRLQYVEFFSKFYKAGGRAFEPFDMNARYVDIAESYDFDHLIRVKASS
ncbi:V-type ATP synthase subunit I [Acetomicrobium hydrogeniformans]|jgi:V/A-type H+-transporting ATPase subunit I|uniref:V-type ATPase subunit family protein n=1 Tax=Acetomicrobium hydrogeniformans ATCC BAA-1850 TaxID=592015 RepID=A0A0T5XD46_9BACT|nr:V-type ATP synthase subunit I [Acetomicrobium hydrogeniformans]KRT36266.1 V-type ATPase subunit family protein [Acetomicrobium hydrogeniformans ATCC BAA-1850]